MAEDEVDVSDLSDIEVRWKSEAKGAVFRTLTDSSAMYSGLPAISPAPDGGGAGMGGGGEEEGSMAEYTTQGSW